MTELSARFALPLLQAGQAQKELFHNEALVRLDATLHAAVAELSTATPPDAPVAGASWIVGDSTAAPWAGHAGKVATWTSGGWRFVAPVAGMAVWLKTAQRWAWHDGVAWRDDALPAQGLAVGGVQVVGTQQPAIATPSGGGTIDAEARNALAAVLVALRNHGLIDT